MGCRGGPSPGFPNTHSGTGWTGAASLAGKTARTLRRTEGSGWAAFPLASLCPLPPMMLSLLSPPPPTSPGDAAPQGHRVPPPSLCLPAPIQHPPSTHPAPTQHSPSAQERRSLQGCQAHPRTTNNNNNNMQILKLGFSAPKWQQPDPAVGVGGWVSCSSSSAHLGTSGAGLTLGTIQTTEALGGRGGGSASVPPTPPPPPTHWLGVGVPRGFPRLGGALSSPHISWGDAELTLCPFMPGRPAVPGRPRAPYKERPWGDTEPRVPVPPSLVCCARRGPPNHGGSLTWGPGGPRSPGRPGLPASPYRQGHGWWHSPTALSPGGKKGVSATRQGGSDPLPLTSSPFLPGGPAGPRGPMGP